jgi:hypothetical protein
METAKSSVAVSGHGIGRDSWEEDMEFLGQ